MKIVGLITEYNPFHNGHKYHIEKAKEITGADFAVVVMSGNFVQRGAPALLDKYTRCEMALKNGADLVLELPVCYACASAEFFALGAAALLEQLGCIDFLCFGSESGTLEELSKITDILLCEPEKYSKHLMSCLKKGMSYPAARMEALIDCCDKNICQAVLSSPNNILGIEYLKALRKLNSPILPVTIQRIQSGYHDISLEQEIVSASALRKAIKEAKELPEFHSFMPESAYTLLKKSYQKKFPVTENDFSALLYYKLAEKNPENLENVLDASKDLCHKIYKNFGSYTTIEDFIGTLKTKEITYTRISRFLFHILLGLTKNDVQNFLQHGVIYYARILGFNKSCSPLLKQLKKHSRIPLITKMADAKALLSSRGLSMLKKDVFAAHLYNRILYDKYNTILPNEYTYGLVRIP